LPNADRVWYELHFLVPREWEEIVSTWLVEYTARGVACFPQGALTEVVAYCAAASETDTLRTLICGRWEQFCAADGLRVPLQVHADSVSEQDWAESWKAHFHATRVGRRLVVKPSWEQWPPPDQPEVARPDDLLLEIDPQMAFGTGIHATTQLCLEALEQHLRTQERVADVGTGSGILAIAAVRLGAREVEAWEMDPVAVPVAAENLQRNAVSEVCILCEGDALEGLSGVFDLLLANVHTAFLLQIIPRLPGLLTPEGRAILSGTTETSAQTVTEALAAAGLELVEKRSRGEWLALIARR